MSEENRYYIFDTPAGWVGAARSAKGLLCCTLPCLSQDEVRGRLGNISESAVWSPGHFQELADRLRAYFSGKKVSFPDDLDLSVATPFQRRVWETTGLIPHGETRSYSWVAEQIGNPGAARAVGQALGRNPLLIIIPCHRVLARDGGLGGFGGGLEMKRRLLSLEGIR